VGAEEEFRPRPVGLTDLEERTLFHFEQLKESLQWKGDQPPDPYAIHQALAGITREARPLHYLGEVGAPDHEAFTENIGNVRDAFGLVAYPYMSERGKLSMTNMYRWKKGELTLTAQQKQMLAIITTAAGIPDNPEQLTYSFSSIPPTPTANSQQ